jgi:DNA polymerase III, alpha subunit
MRFQDEIRGFSDCPLRADALENLKEGAQLTVGGLITGLKTHVQRDGRPMAFLTIEDFDGSMELLVFGDAYEKLKHILAVDAMVLVHGQVSIREGEKKPKLRVDKALALSESREKLAKSVHVRMKTHGLEESFIKEVFDTCMKVTGTCKLVIHVDTEENNTYRIRSRKATIDPGRDALELLRNKVGKENVWLSKSAA